MKIKYIFLIIILFAFTLFGCGKDNGNEDKPKDSQYVNVIIRVENFGDLEFQLDHNTAPKTVDHFVKLANSGAFDGSDFIRMQEDFVLQGGANAKDSSTVEGEFKANGFNNNLKHTYGVISMARATDPNSASSQFFIVLSDDYGSSLDDNYAAFGKLVDGFDVLENIVNSITSDMYTEDYYGLFM